VVNRAASPGDDEAGVPQGQRLGPEVQQVDLQQGVVGLATRAFPAGGIAVVAIGAVFAVGPVAVAIVVDAVGAHAVFVGEPVAVVVLLVAHFGGPGVHAGVAVIAVFAQAFRAGSVAVAVAVHAVARAASALPAQAVSVVAVRTLAVAAGATSVAVVVRAVGGAAKPGVTGGVVVVAV
jgi:hypothetical protein